ncbi:hypothetical protein [Schleiferilactobacillus shenzhenensis]|uniref:Uncharacterized protein n=1 Tax=Schleiferilactobacillus shenzhenensis LY-73 TaxID=1231336 RepID=U4TMB4_9LACO|nr:hypothetical protein [Schleiferilactobacillus shenzhenensis]ERL64560.1 hypothetical protein L248_0855 [Schleiferilactobacillus shenzhenensis LY-73]
MKKHWQYMRYVGLVGAALLAAAAVTPVTAAPAAAGDTTAPVTLRPVDKYLQAAALLKQDLGDLSGITLYTQSVGTVVTEPSWASYIDRMKPVDWAGDADAANQFNLALDEIAKQWIRLAAMRSLGIDPADKATITSFTAGWQKIQDFAQIQKSLVLNYTGQINQDAALSILQGAKFTQLPTDPAAFQAAVQPVLAKMRQFIEDTVITTNASYARQVGKKRGIADALANLPAKTDDQLPGMPPAFLAGYNEGYYSTAANTSAEQRAGADAGRAAGDAGAPAEDLTEKSTDYRQAYLASYTPAKANYDAQYALGKKAGEQAGTAGSASADLDGATAGYRAGYTAAYDLAKADYDKGTKAGSADGSAGREKADLSSSVSPAYTAGYNQGYTAGQQAIADQTAGIALAQNDSSQKKTTDVTGRSNAFQAAYHGFMAGVQDGTAGTSTDVSQLPDAYQAGYHAGVAAQEADTAAEDAQAGATLGISDSRQGTTTSLTDRRPAFVQAYNEAQAGYTAGKTADAAASAPAGSSAAFSAGFKAGQADAAIQPVGPSPEVIAQDKKAGAAQGISDRQHGVTTAPTGQRPAYNQAYADAQDGYDAGKQAGAGGVVPSDASDEYRQGFAAGQHDAPVTPVGPTPEQIAQDIKDGTAQGIEDIKKNVTTPPADQRAAYHQAYTDAQTGYLDGKKAGADGQAPENSSAAYQAGFTAGQHDVPVTPVGPTPEQIAQDKKAGTAQGISDRQNGVTTKPADQRPAYNQAYADAQEGYDAGQKAGQNAPVPSGTSPEFQAGFVAGQHDIPVTPVGPTPEQTAQDVKDGTAQGITDSKKDVTTPPTGQRPAYNQAYADAQAGYTDGKKAGTAGQAPGNASAAYQAGFTAGQHDAAVTPVGPTPEETAQDVKTGTAQGIADIKQHVTTPPTGQRPAYNQAYADAQAGYTAGKKAGSTATVPSNTTPAYQAGFAAGQRDAAPAPQPAPNNGGGTNTNGGYPPAPAPRPTPSNNNESMKPTIIQPTFQRLTTVIYVQTSKAPQYAYDPQTGRFSHLTTVAALPLASAWRTSQRAIMADGTTYYLVGANGYLRAADVATATVVKRSGVVTVFPAGGTDTTNALGADAAVVKHLAGGTNWRFFAVARTADGTLAYLVADDQWVTGTAVGEVVPVKGGIFTIGAKYTPLLRSTGAEISGTVLKPRSRWLVTAILRRDGETHYRVGRDAYVPASSGQYRA